MTESKAGEPIAPRKDPIMPRGKMIAVTHPKGGTAKTTEVVSLGAVADGREMTVTLVDGDAQASTSKWFARAKQSGAVSPRMRLVRLLWPGVEPEPGLVRVQELPHLAEQTDLMLIDCAGHANGPAGQVLELVDRAVVPCGASDFETDELLLALALCEQARQKNPRLRIQVALVKMLHKTRLASEVREEVRSLGVPVLGTEIRHRVRYHMMGRGLVPVEEQAAEQGALLDELLSNAAVPDLSPELREVLTKRFIRSRAAEAQAVRP